MNAVGLLEKRQRDGGNGGGTGTAGLDGHRKLLIYQNGCVTVCRCRATGMPGLRVELPGVMRRHWGAEARTGVGVCGQSSPDFIISVGRGSC